MFIQIEREREKESRGQLLAKELLVDQEDEEVDVDDALVEHLHAPHALVLHLQQVLEHNLLLVHLDAKHGCVQLEDAGLFRCNFNRNALEPR